jgi:hypothetical protein
VSCGFYLFCPSWRSAVLEKCLVQTFALVPEGATREALVILFW